MLIYYHCFKINDNQIKISSKLLKFKFTSGKVKTHTCTFTTNCSATISQSGYKENHWNNSQGSKYCSFLRFHSFHKCVALPTPTPPNVGAKV